MDLFPRCEGRGHKADECRGIDLAARLAERGHKTDELSSFLVQGPTALRPEEGSALVRGQRQGFAASVLKHRTVTEVREVCRLVGLPAGGSKEDLVKRIVAAQCVSNQASEEGDRFQACDRERTPPRRRLSMKTHGKPQLSMSSAPETPPRPSARRRSTSD